MRRGELRGLRWTDCDLAAGLLTIRHGWDDYTGQIATKSVAGERVVPITALSHNHLAVWKQTTGRGGRDLVFGATASTPFTPTHIRKQALQAWADENALRAKREKGENPLVPLGLHECRHVFVSLMHDAGMSLEEIGDLVGHSATSMTDRYRHLIAGHSDKARLLMDDYFARADTAARIAQVEGNE